ncbi:S41 family peptidase [Pedobacter suwonensis]
MRLYKLLLFIVILSCGCDFVKKEKPNYNFDFETLKNKNTFSNWEVENSLETEINGFVTHDSSSLKGRYSALLVSGADNNNIILKQFIRIPENSRRVLFKGTLKEDVIGGYASLLINFEDELGDEMFEKPIISEKIIGKKWKDYKISFPVPQGAKKILVGAQIAGKGKLWADNLNLFVDDINILDNKNNVHFDADFDNEFRDKSGIENLKINQNDVHFYANLGMIWGFLKYYHPAIIKGKYNWDAALFRLIPKVSRLKSDDSRYAVVERWIDGLGPIPIKSKSNKTNSKDDQAKPDYGYIFSKHNLPKSLALKLENIRENYQISSESYYIKQADRIGNPIFTNELKYNRELYPDAGLRLLSLFSYWNKIQYFYPYRPFINDWNSRLSKYIPEFLNARNKEEYLICCLKLITTLNDSHAIIGHPNELLDSIKGTNFMPIEMKFIEKKLVVISSYEDVKVNKTPLKRGDIITHINGISIDELYHKYIPLTPGSNISVKERNLASVDGFLSRSHEGFASLNFKREKKSFKTRVRCFKIKDLEVYLRKYFSRNAVVQGYRLINKNIGLINVNNLKNNDLQNVIKLMKDTKGIIFDFRTAPAIFMPYTYGAWVKADVSPFARASKIDINLPGKIVYSNYFSNGDFSSKNYMGKLFFLVNSETQSQAEFTVMALRSAKNAYVVGSQTAGADGDISKISLPGRIDTYISGTGIYYPNLIGTQQKGIKIDYEVSPTINGIIKGNDEVLDFAIKKITN